MLGIPGGIEIVAVIGIAVLLFGSQKIPKLARSVGQAQGELRKGVEESQPE
jgi:sec-independent protein translocase protein TatA